MTLRPTGYVAGTDHVTLADLAFLSSYTTFVAAGLVDISKYPALTAWFEKVKKEVPNYERANGEGIAAFETFYQSKLADC